MKKNDVPVTDACAPPESALLSVDEVHRRIRRLARCIAETERIAVRAALGRVLAETVISPIDVPPASNSAMDGYAVMSADLPNSGSRSLKVAGKALAGAPFDDKVMPGQAIRIMTGAVMPPGTDTVIMQEQAQREGDYVRIQCGHCPGEYVRQAGEDIARGEVVLSPGKRLMPAELGLLASVGITEVTVTRRLRAAFFSTGDELRSPGDTLHAGQLYDSNRYLLYGMLQRMDVDPVDLGIVPDDPAAIRNTLTQAAAQADVVVTSGGVSVGEADYVKQVLDELGKIDLWRIAMKPGKPLTVGTLGKAIFFGLPGNPVSTMVTFYQFVKPAMLQMMGQRESQPTSLWVPCISRLTKVPGRQEYQRGILTQDRHGLLSVASAGLQESHILTSMSRSNCFIILPAECAGVEPGENVEVQPFAGLI
jgi:molybdopterin molybdotransferase